MAESAALLVNEVLPQQPMRQWVLSFPPGRLRHTERARGLPLRHNRTLTNGKKSRLFFVLLRSPELAGPDLSRCRYFGTFCERLLRI